MKNISTSNGQGSLTPQTVKKKIRLMDREFTFSDLKQKMNDRKVLGEYTNSTIEKYLKGAIKFRFIERVGHGKFRKIKKHI